MVNRHHRIKGKLVKTVENPDRTVESRRLLILIAVAFDLYYFSKMDEVHIISDIYMDDVGILVIVSMYQYTKGDQGSNNGIQSLDTTGST